VIETFDSMKQLKEIRKRTHPQVIADKRPIAIRKERTASSATYEGPSGRLVFPSQASASSAVGL
jgi:hypothetical protein